MSPNICWGGENKAVEFVLEIHNQYPTPKFSAGYKIVPDGKLVESNGITSTVEKYYCRKSPSGYLIKSGGKDWSSMFGKTPDFNGDKIFARFGDEYLFRASKDAPFQYSQNVALMTNELKNGFILMKQEALSILGMISDLGISDMFDIESQGVDKTSLRLKLKTFPDIYCLGKLTFSNNQPSTLVVLFTNKLNDTMEYRYAYGRSGKPDILDFNEGQLVVSNLSLGTFRFGRTVRVMAMQNSDDFSKRSDFGFGIDLPENKTWVWVGDKIKGMDEKLDHIAKNGGGSLAEVPQQKKSVVNFIRIVIISLAVAPFVVWCLLTLIKKKKQTKI